MRFGLVSSAALLVGVLSVGGSAWGQQALFVGPSPLNFGTYSPGQTSATTILVVSNMNNTTVTIGTPTIGGADPSDFAITTNQCPSSLTANNSCAVYVDFAPTAEGARTATLSVTSTYGTGSATLNGTAVPATFSPSTVSFPSTPVGQTSSTETTTLTNNTSSALTGLSATVTAGYAITATTCTGTLAASPASCTVTMTFSPTAIGPNTGTLSVTDNIGTQTAPLTGMGLAATAPAITFPTEAVGATESATVTFTFATTTTLPASSVTVLTQGSTGLDFTPGTQLGTACTAQTYNAGQTCTVVVNFKAGAPGGRQGAVSLYNYISTPYNSMTPIVVGTAYLQGIGTGANAVFYPGTGTSAIFSYLSGPTVPLVNAAGITVFGDSRAIYYLPAGSSQAATLVPSGGHAVNMDGAGNIYYATGNTVYEIPYFGVVSEPSEQSPVEIATLPSAPDNSMMIDGMGNLFVPTSGTGSGGGIYKIATGTHAVTTVIAQGATTSDGGTLGRTIGVYMDAAGDMYLADFTNNKIDEVLAGSSTVTVIQGVDGYLNQPYSVAVDPAGDLFVTNYGGLSYLLKYALVSGSYVRTQYSSIIANDGVTFDNQGNLVLVAGDNITRYTQTATPTLAFAATADGATSATQSTNLQNEGNAPLTFTSVAASSTNFSLNNSTCSANTPLAIGANCNIVAAFTPQSSGSLTGTANLVGNNLAAATETQTVTLTGTANFNLGFTTPPPATLQTGQSAGTVVAALENSNGSVNTSAAATAITLTLTGPSGYTTTTYNGTTATTGGGAGTVTFNLTAALAVPGSYTYTLTDANGDTSASASETVYAYKLAITGVTTPQAASATTNAVTVAITDNSGNATTQTNAITLAVTGPNSYSQSYGPTAAGTNGQVTFTAAALTVPGSYTYTASAAASPDGTAVTGTSATQVITAAAASMFTVAPASTTAVIGYPDSITVSASDAYGNLVTTYAGTVALTSTDPGPAALPGNFTLSSGTATVPVTFRTLTNSGWTVTATDTTNAALTGTSVAIVVQPIPVYTINSSTASSDTSAVCTNQAAAGSAAGTTTDADCNIYAAFAAVTALNNTATTSYVPVVNFASSFPATLSANTLTLATPVTVTGNFALNGPGASALTLTGANAANVNFLTQTAASASTISGLTFTQFTAANGSVFAPSGGTTNFTNDVFTNNTATGSYGGGVFYGNSLTITGSTFSGNKATAYSGGVAWIGGGTNKVSNSTFTGNTAGNTGGALFVNGGTLTLSTNTYTSNTAKQGGAVYSNANATESASSYVTNSASNSSSGDGGAMYTDGTLNIANSTFTGNHASAIGGAVCALGVLTMTTGTSTFSGNYVSAASGGNAGALYANTTSNISSVNFLNNYVAVSAGNASGGAVYLLGAATVVTNSLFSGNYVSGTGSASGGGVYGTGKFTGDTFYGNYTTGSAATQQGGAIYRTNTLTLYNDTITGNNAKAGGGVYGTSTAYNTVISGNTATSTYRDEEGVTVSGTNYIDTSTTATCTTNCTAVLSALGNYGGPTQTMVPLPGSPLLAAGTATGTPINGATTDGRGATYPRTVSYNGATAHTDLGAVTANYTLDFVTQPVNTAVNAALLPPPTVQLFESGLPFGGTGGTLAVAAESGTLYTNSADSTVFTSVTTAASGLESIAPFFSAPQSDDALIVSVKSGAATPVTVASTTSEPFNIGDTSAASIAFSTPPPPALDSGNNAGTVTVALTNSGGATNTSATAAVTLTVTGPGSYSQTYGPTAAVNGLVSFNLSSASLTTAGTYTYAATAPAYTTDTATAPETVGGEGVWVVDASGTLVKVSTAGALATLVANASGTTASFGGVAFDFAGDVFSVNAGANALAFVTYGGGTVATYTGGGLNAPVSLAVDGAGYVWIANSGNSTVSEFNNARTAVSASTGYGTAAGLSAPSAVVLDGTGGVWVTNKGGNSVTHIFGAATPVVTPLSSATANGTLGARP